MTHGPLFTNPRRRQLGLWAVLATLNLGAGLLIALQPESMSDFATQIGASGEWLFGGQDVYATPGRILVYPPHSVVLLSPLALLPYNAAEGLWVMVNVALVFLSGYLAARVFQPHAAFRTVLLPILMFASWWGAHTLVQFSLAALTLSMAAMMLAERRPLVSGVCQGLALMKPQIGLPVLLWMMFTGRWKLVATAVATVLVGTAIYCARVTASPVAVAQRLLANLRIYYTGDALMTGSTNLRPFIRRFVENVGTVDLITAALVLGLLAGICAVGFQEGRRRDDTLYAAPPLAACWSLMTFYHLSYGFVVLLPVLMLLGFSDAPHSALRRSLFWVLQIGMMVNVPGVLRHSGFADEALAAALIHHVDRFLTLGIFAGLVTLAWREA